MSDSNNQREKGYILVHASSGLFQSLLVSCFVDEARTTVEERDDEEFLTL